MERVKGMQKQTLAVRDAEGEWCGEKAENRQRNRKEFTNRKGKNEPHRHWGVRPERPRKGDDWKQGREGKRHLLEKKPIIGGIIGCYRMLEGENLQNGLGSMSV